jgi:hypothetical protein
MWRKFLFLSIGTLVFFIASAQRIVYSEPDREDNKSTNFEVIGKMNDHFLIYKNTRANYNISLYDNAMKLVRKEKLEFMPERIINADILAYKDLFYLLYQYQKRNIVYCMAAHFDANAKLVGEPKVLDTTEVTFLANNKIYSFLYSEDKQKIAVNKINRKDDLMYVVTTSLFDNDLNPLSKTSVRVSMPERSDFLTEFNIDNEGDLVFLRASGTAQNDNINKVTIITKKASDDSINEYDLNVNKMYLDDIRVKVDNINQNYLITSFNSKSRRGNIDGLYCAIWNKTSASIIAATNNVFGEELRNNAKSEGNSRYAFNNFFLQNIVMRKDGGFVIAAESAYSSTRGNTLSRWDYLYGSPFWSPSAYYMYSTPYGFYYPWWRSGSFANQNTRYFADNIVLLSFDSSSRLEWSNVIRKSQYDDNTDNFIGYTTMNTGSEVHFLFNQLERKQLLLTDQSVTPDGQIHRSPTIRNLDRGYQFMPRFGKQVGAKQMIIPCQYRNYICFAKVDF